MLVHPPKDGTITAMSEIVRTVTVSREARAKVIRAALSGRLVQATMTAGQRRAVRNARQDS